MTNLISFAFRERSCAKTSDPVNVSNCQWAEKGTPCFNLDKFLANRHAFSYWQYSQSSCVITPIIENHCKHTITNAKWNLLSYLLRWCQNRHVNTSLVHRQWRRRRPWRSLAGKLSKAIETKNKEHWKTSHNG